MTQQLTIKDESRSLTYVDPAAVAAAETAKARIQSAYVMAYQRPRSEDQARVRILEACKRPAFAERVEYSKPVGGRSITGPSVRFAELALREWGNILSESQVIYEDTETRRVRVTVIDLETNASFSKELAIKKTVERKKAEDREVVGQRLNKRNELVFIVLATEDELHNKEAAMISKALRNEGLRVIPSDIVDEAMETAKATLRNRDSQDPKAAKKRVLDAFALLGIKPNDLQAYLGHSLDSLSPAELETLRGVHAAIKEGDASWADYVSPKKESPEGEGKSATEKLAEATRKPRSDKGVPRKQEAPETAPEPPLPGPEAPSEPPLTGPQGDTKPSGPGYLVDSEGVQDMESYCTQLGLIPGDVAKRFGADKLSLLTKDEAGQATGWLLDQLK